VFINLAYVSTKALRVALGATLAVLATVALVAASPVAIRWMGTARRRGVRWCVPQAGVWSS
jgi:hypothetical protein